MSKSVVTVLLVVLLAFGWGAIAEEAAEPKPLARSKLPKPIVFTSFHDEPSAFHVRMDNGKVVAIDAVAPPMSANLEIRLIERSDESTMVEIKSSLPGRIKFDLHLSNDDESYYYTSSCPLDQGMGTFENWPYRIEWLALSNIRAVDEDQSTCE